MCQIDEVLLACIDGLMHTCSTNITSQAARALAVFWCCSSTSVSLVQVFHYQHPKISISANQSSNSINPQCFSDLSCDGYICYCHTSTKLAFHPHSFSTNMTIVLNDPALLPFINAERVYSYFAGLRRAIRSWSFYRNLTLAAILQLPPWLGRRMIGVSMVIFILKDFWYLTSVFSTYTRTRGTSMLRLEQPSC